MMRTLGVIIGAGLMAILAGCATDDTPQGQRRVETWTRSTTWVDGQKVTTNEHSVGYKDVPQTTTQNWAFTGVWNVEDYTDTAVGSRKCQVEIFATKLGEFNYRSRLLQPCHGEMRNIVAWRPTGETLGDVIIFVDGGGNNIAEFERIGASLYRGVFTLTNGEVVKAHLKRW